MAQTKLVLVTGATGKQGGAVVDALLTRGPTAPQADQDRVLQPTPQVRRGIRCVGGAETWVNGIVLGRADDALLERSAELWHRQDQPGV